MDNHLQYGMDRRNFFKKVGIAAGLAAAGVLSLDKLLGREASENPLEPQQDRRGLLGLAYAMVNESELESKMPEYNERIAQLAPEVAATLINNFDGNVFVPIQLPDMTRTIYCDIFATNQGGESYLQIRAYSGFSGEMEEKINDELGRVRHSDDFYSKVDGIIKRHLSMEEHPEIEILLIRNYGANALTKNDEIWYRKGGKSTRTYKIDEVSPNASAYIVWTNVMILEAVQSKLPEIAERMAQKMDEDRGFLEEGIPGFLDRKK